MHFKVLCLLLLIKTLKIDARARIPIPIQTQQSSISIENTTENLNLPRGFDPVPSPMNPLLYPFVTEEPSKTITSAWRPITTNRTTTESPARVHSMEARFASASKESHEQKTNDGPVLESIVYGAWKPEGPVQPNLTETKETDNEKWNNGAASTSSRNIIRRRLGGFIEEIKRRKSSSESLESNEQTRADSKQPNKKQGRRKIPNFAEKKSYETVKSEGSNPIKVIKMNASDPELLNIVKQINESVENTPSRKHLSKETKSEEYSYAPKLLNANSKISKEWPIDFMYSNESSRNEDSSLQDNFFNFVGDSSEPPQSIATLNLDDLLATDSTINITKMGVPYEHQNSAEEPSICVPLGVRERSASNPNEIVDVERVYCFPLPTTDERRISENKTVTLDKDATFHVVSYEELTKSSGTYIRGMFLLISLSFLLI